MPWRITTGTGPSAFDTHLEYDAFERRIAKRSNDETTHYVGDLYEHVAKTAEVEHRYKVFAGSQQVAQVVRTEVGGAVTATNTTYIHDDHLGSASTITNQAGAVLEARQYGPFGDTTTNFAATDLRTGFTGHQHDGELGLINMRGRLYDPTLGQFVQADPLVSTLNPRGLNRYAYVMNNPLMNTDPSGFFGIPFLNAVRETLFGGDEESLRPNEDDKKPGDNAPATNPLVETGKKAAEGNPSGGDAGSTSPVSNGGSEGAPDASGGGTAPDPGRASGLGGSWPGGGGTPPPPGYNGPMGPPGGGIGSENRPLPNQQDSRRGNFLANPSACVAQPQACAAAGTALGLFGPLALPAVGLGATL